MISSVDAHPDKKTIIDMLLSGVSLRRIAAVVSPPISFNAIQRYKVNVIRPAAIQEIAQKKADSSAVQKAVQVAASADPFLTRMAEKRAERDRAMTLALPEKATLGTADLRAWCAADRNDIAATELQAKLEGRLDATPGVQLTIVMPAQAPTVAEQAAGGDVIDISVSR